MKRISLLLLLMAFADIGAHAQTKMHIHQKTGGSVEVTLNDKPVVAYEGNELVVKSRSNSTLRFVLNTLEKITYSNVSTLVEDMSILSKNAGPSRIYDINGRLVMTVLEDEAVETMSLPSGIYIIKNNNGSYKIQK